MEAAQKCINKWQKRLEKAEKQRQMYGNSYYNNYTEKILTYQEIIKDLKRLTSC
jgi:hypothetical protein